MAGSPRLGQRSRRTPWFVAAGLAALFLASVGVTLLVEGGGDDGAAGTAVLPSAPVDEPTEDRLTSASRLGYAGLGPVLLGMTIEEAERAGRLAIVPSSCELMMQFEPSSGLPEYGVYVSQTQKGAIGGLSVVTPAISTISGIRPGSTREDVHRTYPSAVDVEGGAIRITNSEGRRITFVTKPDDTVYSMVLHGTEPLVEIDPRC